MYRHPVPNQEKIDNSLLIFTKKKVIFLGLFVLGILVIIKIIGGHVSANSLKIESGTKGNCLDLHTNNESINSSISSWECNGSVAQEWESNGTFITHSNKYCISVIGDKKQVNSLVGLNYCNNNPGQVWLNFRNGFQNPNSGLCLTTDTSNPHKQLYITDCNQKIGQVWLISPKSNSYNTSCTINEGAAIACIAEKEWTLWESGKKNHAVLLSAYTDGAPYEEWCADYVSYIYKTAGYPFTKGEADKWDENIAGNIQNMGFTKHLVSTGYIPKTGDVAYFDYNGGHVEIVVSGGKNPSFIYGNSAKIDPTTGNGQMMANTIISDGEFGKLIYYLSPI